MLKDLDDFLDQSLERGHVVGSWGFHSNLDFTRMTSESNNVWFFEQIFNFLRAFFGVVLPDSIELVTTNATQRVERKGLDQMTFLDEFMLILKKLKEPLWTAKLNLNLVGFLRTSHDPDNPVRIQIQEPTTHMIWGGPDESGFQSFSIGYTLFSDTVLEGESTALWSVNQPLLEKALRKWEQQTGKRIEVVKSNANLPMHKYGFDRPTKKGGPLKPPPVPPRPAPPKKPTKPFLPGKSPLDELV